MNEIIAVPNPLPLVTGIEGSLELGGQVLYPALPQGSFPERFSISSDLLWQATLPDSPLKKVSGTDGGSSPVLMLQRIPKEQSFWTHASPGRITSSYQSFHVGVVDNLNRFSGFFAQANPGVAGANWGVGAQVQGVPVGGE